MPGKKAIRKLIKKKQRQRRRQKQAQERDNKEKEEEVQKQKDPAYQNWLKQQVELEEFERLANERQQQDEEEAWLRREALAQRQFSLDAAKKRLEEEKIIQLREQQAQELALIKEKQRQRQEESKRMAAKAEAEFEVLMSTMDDYLNDSDELKAPPLELLRVVETHPQERLCEFFTRTNCCRFGHTCTHNHRRPMLGKILLIRHFFSHPLLKQSSSDDYLELTEHDLRESYDEFFYDAVAEMEKFGKIINFRALRNTLDYLRGHVFVEYAHERHALRAFINLQGRYYASKQLNVEFSNLRAWRGAVCGLSLNRKCPKGYSCAYLHLFRNPNNLFNKDLEHSFTPRSGHIISAITTPKNSWNDDSVKDRNWRWSESPEVEVTQSKTLANQISDPITHSNCNENYGTSSSNSYHKPDSERSSSQFKEDHKNRGLRHSRSLSTEKNKRSPSIKKRRTDHSSDSKIKNVSDPKVSKSNGHQSRKSSTGDDKEQSCSRSASKDKHKHKKDIRTQREDHLYKSHRSVAHNNRNSKRSRSESSSRSRRKSYMTTECKISKKDRNSKEDRRDSKSRGRKKDTPDAHRQMNRDRSRTRSSHRSDQKEKRS